MKIALDAMGGDFAPTAVIKGAVEALSCTPKNVELILLEKIKTHTNFLGCLPRE